jgi:hypothetical protein
LKRDVSNKILSAEGHSDINRRQDYKEENSNVLNYYLFTGHDIVKGK